MPFGKGDGMNCRVFRAGRVSARIGAGGGSDDAGGSGDVGDGVSAAGGDAAVSAGDAADAVSIGGMVDAVSDGAVELLAAGGGGLGAGWVSLPYSA
jgi:hypothetical protein